MLPIEHIHPMLCSSQSSLRFSSSSFSQIWVNDHTILTDLGLLAA
jgi:hypothetical protein